MTGKHEGAQPSKGTRNLSSPEDKPPMAATKAQTGRPPPEKPETTRIKFLAMLSFWAVIVFLGLPMWWKTTSIYRARLPLEEMSDWADGKACRPVFPLQILVRAPSIPDPEAQHLIRTTQHAIDDLNDFSAHHLRLSLVESLGGPTADESDLGISGQDVALNLKLLPQENAAAPSSELHQYSPGLDIFYPSSQVPSTSSSNSPLASFIASELQNLFNEEQATLAYILSSGNVVGPSIQPSISGGQPSQNAQASHGGNREQRSTVMKSVDPQLAEDIAQRLTRSFKYAETYHLTFSLFTPGADPSSWDIEAALQEYMSPLLDAFSTISNFSVDTQVQLYAAFSPTTPLPEYNEEKAAWYLKKEDLSAFINAAEWPLSPSIGSGPTINFVLYVPSPSQSPLLISESHSTSWLIPQWGGVMILNQPNSPNNENPTHLPKESLLPALSTFSHQLLTLIGVPTTPPSLPLRLHSLLRTHTATLLLSSSSTMGSLARLTNSLPSIPIPLTVADSVSSTLAHLSSACSLLRDGRFVDALASARVAEAQAERSFFEKSMVGQVYFPDEHKVAVYLPLLGPIGVPLLMCLIKEVKRVVGEWRARRAVGK
ncbi:GPI transamidase component [Arachnomyces sp. PD_36]|nr:GPI transamidase component [Arachnomyces sp. PD_36]